MTPLPDMVHGNRLIYAAGESCADILYATGLQTPDPFLWYQAGDKKGLVVSSLEVGRAQKLSGKSTEILSLSDAARLWLDKTPPISPAKLIAGLAHYAGEHRWSVPEAFPYGLAKKLAETGIELVPVKDFFPERQVKTADEVTHIRYGVRLAEIGLERAVQILSESTVSMNTVLQWQGNAVTAELLQREIDATIARHGGTASHTIAAPGTQAADPHESGTGPIHAHQPIVIDIFPRVDATGYHGDLTRTLVKGKAPGIVRKAYHAVRQAQQAAVDCLRVGVSGKDVHTTAENALVAAGFTTTLTEAEPMGFIHGTGHGLGLEIHELPRVNSSATTPLQAGNVITIEPGLYYPEWGGVRLEDVVVVTDGGCKSLTTAPFTLEID